MTLAKSLVGVASKSVAFVLLNGLRHSKIHTNQLINSVVWFLDESKGAVRTMSIRVACEEEDELQDYRRAASTNAGDLFAAVPGVVRPSVPPRYAPPSGPVPRDQPSSVPPKAYEKIWEKLQQQRGVPKGYAQRKEVNLPFDGGSYTGTVDAIGNPHGKGVFQVVKEEYTEKLSIGGKEVIARREAIEVLKKTVLGSKDYDAAVASAKKATRDLERALGKPSAALIDEMWTSFKSASTRGGTSSASFYKWALLNKKYWHDLVRAKPGMTFNEVRDNYLAPAIKLIDGKGSGVYDAIISESEFRTYFATRSTGEFYSMPYEYEVEKQLEWMVEETYNGIWDNGVRKFVGEWKLEWTGPSKPNVELKGVSNDGVLFAFEATMTGGTVVVVPNAYFKGRQLKAGAAGVTIKTGFGSSVVIMEFLDGSFELSIDDPERVFVVGHVRLTKGGSTEVGVWDGEAFTPNPSDETPFTTPDPPQPPEADARTFSEAGSYKLALAILSAVVVVATGAKRKVDELAERRRQAEIRARFALEQRREIRRRLAQEEEERLERERLERERLERERLERERLEQELLEQDQRESQERERLNQEARAANERKLQRRKKKKDQYYQKQKETENEREVRLRKHERLEREIEIRKRLQERLEQEAYFGSDPQLRAPQLENSFESLSDREF